MAAIFQDGRHRDNDIPHKLVSIQPILVIFVSNGMFWGMLNSFMTL